jgi:hypothetical protein
MRYANWNPQSGLDTKTDRLTDRHLQCDFDLTLTSVASVTTTLAPRGHRDSESTNSSTTADSTSVHQASQLWQELRSATHQLTSTELSRK